MIINIGICCSYIIILLIIGIVFLIKSKINKLENNYFKNLIFITLFGLILECFIYYFAIFISKLSIFDCLIKLLYIYYVIWMYNFVLYNFVTMFNIREKQDSKYITFKSSVSIFYLAAFLLSIFLPNEIIINDTYIYPQGIGTIAQYIIFTFGISLIIIIGLFNKKRILKKEFIPLLSCIFLGVISTIVQVLYHEFLFIVPSHAIAVVLIYFTIENPDIKMMKDLRYNKIMLERENEATLRGLNKLSNSLQEPLERLTKLSKKKIAKKNLEATLENTVEIQKISLNLVEQINNIIDISKLTSGKLEIKKVHYLTEDLIDELQKLTDEYQVEYQITEKFPKLLYGDPEKVKQGILYLLNFINKGFVKPKITIDIDTITVGMLCKIKFKIIVNYQSKLNNLEIYKFNNKILFKTTLIEYEIYERIIELLQGKNNYLIKDDQIIFSFSLYNKLNEISEMKESFEKIKYFDAFDKRILIIDDNHLSSKLLIKELEKYNVKIEICSFEEDFLELINSDKTYDLFLYNDEVVFEHYALNNEDNIKNSLNRLRLIAGYRLPFVVITSDDKYINSNVEFLINPLDKKQLNLIITKHLKED